MKLLILVLLASLEASAATDLAPKLSLLLKQSAAQGNACDKYAAELNQTARLQHNDKGLYFTTPDTARKTLAKLATIPPTPQTTKKASELLSMADDTTLAKNEVAVAASRLRYCGYVSIYHALMALLDGIQKYELSTSDQDKLSKIVINYVDNESTFTGTMVSTLIQTQLLNTLVRLNMIKVSPQQAAKLADIQQRLQNLKTNIAKLYDQDKHKDPFAHFAMEFRETDKLRQQLRGVFTELQKSQTGR